MVDPLLDPARRRSQTHASFGASRRSLGEGGRRTQLVNWLELHPAWKA
jgi:hypothetical protein